MALSVAGKERDRAPEAAEAMTAAQLRFSLRTGEPPMSSLAMSLPENTRRRPSSKCPLLAPVLFRMFAPYRTSSASKGINNCRKPLLNICTLPAETLY